MTFSIISRHIDLSPGSMLALFGVGHGHRLPRQRQPRPRAARRARRCIASGVANGILVSRPRPERDHGHARAYIWARGLALGFTHGNPIVVDAGLPHVMNATCGRLQRRRADRARRLPRRLVPALGARDFGRYTYAMGGDPTGARRAGINVALYTTLVFVLMGADDVARLDDRRRPARLGAAVCGGGARARRDHRGDHRRQPARRRRGARRAHAARGRVHQHPQQRPAQPRPDDAYYQLYKGGALLAVLSVQICCGASWPSGRRRRARARLLSRGRARRVMDRDPRARRRRARRRAARARRSASAHGLPRARVRRAAAATASTASTATRSATRAGCRSPSSSSGSAPSLVGSRRRSPGARARCAAGRERKRRQRARAGALARRHRAAGCLARRAGLPLWRLLGGSASARADPRGRRLLPRPAPARRRRGRAARARRTGLPHRQGARHDADVVARLRAAAARRRRPLDRRCTCAFASSTEARRACCRRLDDLGLGLHRGSVPARAPAADTAARRGDRTPVAAGEDAGGPEALLDLDRGRRCLRVDATTSGGIRAAAAAAAMAAARGRAVMTHAFVDLHGQLAGGLAAVAQAETIPYSSGANPVDVLLARRQPVEDGELVLSEQAGHGMPLDWDAVAAHARRVQHRRPRRRRDRGSDMQLDGIEGRVALVTGGARGIGRCIAETLARPGRARGARRHRPRGDRRRARASRSTSSDEASVDARLRARRARARAGRSCSS